MRRIISGISSGSTSGALRPSATPGQFRTVDVAGQNVLVTRNDADGVLARSTTCAATVARVLCDEPEGTTKAVFQCPYHAWCYDLNGELVATPRVDKDEVDRSALGLKPVHIDEWQGFIFVNLSREDRCRLRESLDSHYDSPLRFERHDMAEPRHDSTHRVGGCGQLEDPHRELQRVSALPDRAPRTRRDGSDLQDGATPATQVVRTVACSIITGGTSYSTDQGSRRRAVLPGMNDEQAHSIYGSQMFPNMFIDVAGSNVVATRLVPEGPTQTRVLHRLPVHARRRRDRRLRPTAGR